MTGMETKRAGCKCLANALVCQLCWTFLFVSRWNRAIFLAVSSPWPLYKTLFFDFWFSPLTPKICTKSPISLWVTESVMVRINGSLSHSLWVMDGSTKFGLGAEIQSPTGLFTQPPMRRMRVCFTDVFFCFFCFFFVFFRPPQKYQTTVLGNGWTDFHETFTKR